MSLAPARSAGLLLLLAAIAMAVSVATRLAGSDEPAAGSGSYLPIVLDTGLYATGGGARVLSGVALLAAAVWLRRALAAWRLWTADAAAGLLALSGLVTGVSGVCMLALAAQLPETTAVAAYAAGPGPLPGWAEPVNAARSIAGKAGFTLAGLGLIALAPAQWRMGGLLKISAAADAVIGIAMLFIWVDAATAMHRISGIAFLLWLVSSGLWLAAGLLKPPAAPAPASGPGASSSASSASSTNGAQRNGNP